MIHMYKARIHFAQGFWVILQNHNIAGHVPHVSNAGNPGVALSLTW